MAGKVTALTGWLILASVGGAQTPPIAVPPGIQEERLIYRVPPVYPKLPKQVRIHGIVKLTAVIDENGAVQRLKVVSGHPLLVKAAFDAVKQWRYRPTTRNGVPVAVMTTIYVTFPDAPPPSSRKPRAMIRV
jgi:periplasmic protein TonB